MAKPLTTSTYLKSNMERFIFERILSIDETSLVFKIQYGEIYIFVVFKGKKISVDLKSNMERFIFEQPDEAGAYDRYLKSNMERFICIANIDEINRKVI